MAYTPEQLSDREAIREVVFRSSHGVDRLDGDWMKSAYWPDAIDDHGVFVGNAWEKFRSGSFDRPSSGRPIGP